MVEYLSTEISTSKQKKFSLVTFVDTPGLVDGDMKYPFDVDETILWLGRRCLGTLGDIIHQADRKVLFFKISNPNILALHTRKSHNL